METTTSIPVDANNIVPPPELNTETLPTMPISPTWKQSFVDRNKRLLIILGSLSAFLFLLIIFGVWRWRQNASVMPDKPLQKTGQQQQRAPQSMQQTSILTPTTSVRLQAQTPSPTPYYSQSSPPAITQARQPQQSKQAVMKNFAVPTKVTPPPPSILKTQQQAQKARQTQQRVARYRPPIQFALHPGPYQNKTAKVINPDQFLRIPPSSFRVKKQSRRQQGNPVTAQSKP